MLNLTYIPEFVVHGLCLRPLVEQYFVMEVHQGVLYVLLDSCNQMLLETIGLPMVHLPFAAHLLMVLCRLSRFM